MPPWDKYAQQGQEPEVVSTGGPWSRYGDQAAPRSLMARTLDDMNPEGAGRRADTRDARTERGARELRDIRGLQMLSPIAGLAGYADKHLGKYMGRDEDEGNRVTGGTINQLPEWMANPAKGFGTGFQKGATFALEDEVAGLLGGDEAKRTYREAHRINIDETPVSNFFGEVAGGVASPINKPLMAVAGVRTAGAAARPVAQLAREGFRAGAVGGGLYGFGAAEGDFTERLDDAAGGAFFGSLFGAAGGAGLGAVGNKLSTGQFFPSGPHTVLDAARDQIGVSGKAIAGLRKTLTGSGYSRNDIDRGLVNITNRLQAASDTGDRSSLFALELQREFPAAQQNIQDVFQQLMTAPPTQGRTGRILTQALDDQYDSQGNYFDDVAQRRLGSSTVADELRTIGQRRQEVGAQRDRSLQFAETDRRSRGIRGQMSTWFDEYSTGGGADTEVMGTMRAAARQLGFSGRTEAADAMASNPVALMNKFQEIAFAKSQTPAGASPVLMQARSEAQKLLDDASRFGRQDENVAFAPRAQGEDGPFKQRQREFRETYSQEDAIQDARNMLGRARDPVQEDGIAMWFDSLPSGEQQLVRTVWRQDLEKMLRGGNIDQDGAYLTNLKKLGLNSTLRRVLGEDGEAISRAIVQLADEQQSLTKLDPRKGLQERVVRGPSADRARNLYTTNPIARAGDRLPNLTQLADLALMSTGNLPYVTMAKQGSKAFRPSARTREGIAQILALRATGQNLPAPTGNLTRMPPRQAGAGNAFAQPAQSTSNSAPSGAAPAGPSPLRTSQRAPWSPAQVPQGPPPEVVARVQTGAQRTADRARQRAVDARQRAADATARRADAETIRRTLVEAKEAEAAAKVAQVQARNAAKVTQAKIRAVAKAARQKVKAAKAVGNQDRELTVREARAAAARRNAENSLDSALDMERRTKVAVKDEAAAMQDRSFAERVKRGTADRTTRYSRAQSIDVAKKNAVADVDPVTTFEDTGHLSVLVGDTPIIVPDVGAKNGDDLVRMLSRVEDDLLGMNANKPERWSDLTRLLWQQVGEDKLVMEIMKGKVPGWRTPAERETAKAGRNMANAAIVTAAAGTAALGVNEGLRQYDKVAQKRRAQAIMDSPDLTKIIQRGLKAAGQYDGRADGKYDKDVEQAAYQFQAAHGLGKTSAPGSMDTATLKALEDFLIFEGKPKLADEIRDIRRNKLKAKEN